MINQHQLKNFQAETISDLQTMKSRLSEICYCVETETFYRYQSSGAAFVVDNLYIVSTAAGGNTRWIGVAGRFNLSLLSKKELDESRKTTGIVIPLYAYPTDIFSGDTVFHAVASLAKKHHTIPMVVILNPASGPGSTVDGNYTGAIKILQGAGIRVLGYVYTTQAARAIADVVADVVAWKTLYPAIDGIWVDEFPQSAPTDTATDTSSGSITNLRYMQLIRAASSINGVQWIFGNQGAPSSYTGMAYVADGVIDKICIWESATPPTASDLGSAGDWVPSFLTTDFSKRITLLHTQATFTMADFQIMREYSSFLYYTNGSGYTTVSTYLEKLLAYLSADLATTSLPGVVKVGTGLSIDAEGTLTPDMATFNFTDLNDVSIASPVSGQVVQYNGTHYVLADRAIPLSAGAGVRVYPTMNPSDLYATTGYLFGENFLDTGAEVTIPVVCNNNKVPVISYISDPSTVNLATILAGLWTMHTWALSDAANSQVVFDFYERTTGGTETLMFTLTTADLTGTLALYDMPVVSTAYTWSAGQRLVLKISVQTTNVTDTTVTVVGGGATHYSWLDIPLPVTHNDLVGLQGGAANEYYHLTAAQSTIMGNTSGTNSGDETKSTIESKLDITDTEVTAIQNLSGVNTGDQLVGSWGEKDYPAWASGTPFVKMTASGTFALDSNNYQKVTPVTTTLYVDVSRTDSYTETGSIHYPYKTISAAITAGNALAVAFCLELAPGTYTDASVSTIAYPCVIHGKGSTYVINSGAGTLTLSNAFSIYDLTIVGNLVQSNTSLATITLASNVTLSGNLTVNGSHQYTGGKIVGNGSANSLITVAATGMGTFQALIIGAQSANYYARMVNSGYLLMLNVELFANDNSNYAIDSSAAGSSLTTTGLLLTNAGTGGGINCANGATTQANEVVSTELFVNGAVNAITCGTAYTYLDVYKAFNTNTGRGVYPTGSNIFNSYFGAFSTSTSMISYIDFIIAGFTLSNTKLTSMYFPNLQNANGALTLSGCTSLQTLSIPNPVYLLFGITLASVASFANLTLGTIGLLMQCGGNIAMSACGLTQASVDNILAVFASLDGNNGTTKYVGSLSIGGGTSAAPTFTGQTGTRAGSNFVASGTTCTVTWAGHGFSTGDLLTMTGLTTVTNCNTTAKITVVDSGNFTYPIVSAYGTCGGTGTYKRSAVDSTDSYSNKQRLIAQGATVSTN